MRSAKKFVNWSATGSSVLSAAFSSASFGSALSVVGLSATVPLGGVGGCFALVSSGLIIASKKLDSKIKKHQEITTLAVAKRDTINRLLSKSFNNNEVTSHDFDIILSEFQQYNSLKSRNKSRQRCFANLQRESFVMLMFRNWRNTSAADLKQNW